MPRPQQAKRWSFPLAVHLMLFTLAVALPIFALAFVAINRAIDAERESLRSGLTAHARVLSGLIASRVEDFVIASRAIANSKNLEHGDFAGLSSQVEPIIRSVGALGAEVATAEGNIVFSTSGAKIERSGEVRYNSRDVAQISDVRRDADYGEPFVRVSVAAGESKPPVYLVSILAPASEFQKLLTIPQYARGWVIGILDRNLNFVARQPDPDRVGTAASTSWRKAIARTSEGIFQLETLEGEQTLTAYTPTTHGWTVGIAVPTRILDEPAVASRRYFLISSVLGLLTSMLLAAFVGRWLSKKAMLIENAADALTVDRNISVQTTGIREYDRLLSSLRRSADLLNLRKHERDDFEKSRAIAGSRLHAALSVAELAVYEWNPETDVVSFDGKFRDMWGLDGDMPVLSRNLIRRITKEHRQLIRDRIAIALDPAGEGIFASEFKLVSQGEEGERWLYCRSQTEFEDGRAVRVIGASRDITDRKLRENELEAQRQELHTMANAMPQIVWVADPSGQLLYINDRRSDYSAGTGGPLEWQSMVFADDLAPTIAAWNRARQNNESYSVEHRLIMQDGTVQWHLSRALATRNAQGEVVKWYGTATNIHEHKMREQHVRFLLAEVNHRSKNLLAVVQAIVRQTVKSARSVEEFTSKFNARVKSLATSQELITEQNWDGVAMADLARSQLSHYAELIGDRIILEGPFLQLGPEVAQSIGMAIHELSTNAAKYGALSNSVGVVNLTWRIEAVENAQMLHIEWREKNGPAVAAPEGNGFGSFVIDRMLSGRWGADIEMRFDDGGFVWTFRAPLANLSAKGYRNPAGA